MTGAIACDQPQVIELQGFKEFVDIGLRESAPIAVVIDVARRRCEHDQLREPIGLGDDRQRADHGRHRVPDEHDIAQVKFTNYVDDIGGVSRQRRIFLRVPARRIRLPAADVVDEQQAKVPLQPVDDPTPQLLIAAEPMREEDQWPVRSANDLDVVPGVDVHASTVSCPAARIAEP